MSRLLVFSFLLCLTMSNAYSQSAEVLKAFAAETFTSSNQHQLPYRILWPEGYNREDRQTYPLVLFLHGAGERGNDNKKQLIHGSSLFIEPENRERFPAIVVMPQCAGQDYWAQMTKTEDGDREFDFRETPNASLAAVMELLDKLMIEEAVDPDRVYLMGLSMGGMGTFELLARRPHTFAAAIPICGGTNPALLPIYAGKVPLWIFHGEADHVVEVENSRRVVRQLEALGVTVHYTEYPGVNHNSWDPAFAEPNLLPWLFGQHRQ